MSSPEDYDSDIYYDDRGNLPKNINYNLLYSFDRGVDMYGTCNVLSRLFRNGKEKNERQEMFFDNLKAG